MASMPTRPEYFSSYAEGKRQDGLAKLGRVK
jgi:hypothetical protein